MKCRYNESIKLLQSKSDICLTTCEINCLMMIEVLRCIDLILSLGELKFYCVI